MIGMWNQNNVGPLPNSVTIVSRLRSRAETSNLLGSGDLYSEAATEIERLRSEVRRLQEMKSPTEQRAIGYAEAQSDIRRALGIKD